MVLVLAIPLYSLSNIVTARLQNSFISCAKRSSGSTRRVQSRIVLWKLVVVPVDWMPSW